MTLYISTNDCELDHIRSIMYESNSSNSDLDYDSDVSKKYQN